jgi:hypothetical protein
MRSNDSRIHYLGRHLCVSDLWPVRRMQELPGRWRFSIFPVRRSPHRDSVVRETGGNRIKRLIINHLKRLQFIGKKH